MWLKTRRAYISERVYDDYESIIDARIAKYPIGKMQIKSLTVNAFNMFFIDMSKKYSKASIHKTWVVCKQVLKYGFDEQDIPFFDVDKIVKLKETQVAVKKKDVPFVTKEDLALLTAEMYNEKYGNGARAIVFVAYSGLRLSELIELKWKNVADDLGTIKIVNTDTKAIQRDENLAPIKKNGRNVYMKLTKGTKSEDSQRTVPMSKQGKEILEYFKQFKHTKDDYVFINQNGKQYERRILERLLTRMCQNANCSRTDYTPHCLRHGYGSILVQNGIDIKIVSELLGHSDIAFTYNTYIGITKEDKTKAVNNVFDNM